MKCEIVKLDLKDGKTYLVEHKTVVTEVDGPRAASDYKVTLDPSIYMLTGEEFIDGVYNDVIQMPHAAYLSLVEENNIPFAMSLFMSELKDIIYQFTEFAVNFDDKFELEVDVDVCGEGHYISSATDKSDNDDFLCLLPAGELEVAFSASGGIEVLQYKWISVNARHALAMAIMKMFT